MSYTPKVQFTTPNPYAGNTEYQLMAVQPIKQGETAQLTYRRIAGFVERAFSLLKAAFTYFQNDQSLSLRYWNVAFLGFDTRIRSVDLSSVKIAPPPRPRLPATMGPHFEHVREEVVMALADAIEVTNEKHQKLDLDELKGRGLLPQDRYTVDNVTYYFSKPIKVEDRLYLLMLVDSEGGIFPRICYLSNSQGTWRSLPAAMKDETGQIRHLGKGLKENDTQLPISINLAIHTRGLEKPIALPSDYQLFNPVGSFYNHTPSYTGKVSLKDLMGMVEGAPEFFKRDDWTIPRCGDPTQYKMPEDTALHPDPSTLEEFDIELPKYGPVKAKVFLSTDKSIKYLFYETNDQRAFLAYAEQVLDSPINDYGLRSIALDTKGQEAPLLEYNMQIPKGYDPKRPDKNRYLATETHYRNNWNFVKEMPIIKWYYETQQRQMPAKL